MNKAARKQRGSFAIAAVLMLLVVVAVSMRLLTEVSQGVSSRSFIALESTQAALMADSGIETALAVLDAGGGRPTDCSTSALGSGTPATGLSYELLASNLSGTRTVPSECHPDGRAPICRVTSIGSAGQGRRNANVDLAYCSPLDSGKTGVGGNGHVLPTVPINPIQLKIRPRSAPSIVVVNLAAAVKHPAIDGNLRPDRSVCATDVVDGTACQIRWSEQTGTGNVSVVSQGFVALETELVSYQMLQYLGGNDLSKSADRHYAAAGAIFEGPEAVRIDGISTQTIKGDGQPSPSIILEGASGSGGWCQNADTIVFGMTLKGEFSSSLTRLKVESATLRSRNPASPLLLSLKPLQRGAIRYDSSGNVIPDGSPLLSGNGLFSEVWYLHSEPALIEQLFSPEGKADFLLSLGSDGTIPSSFRWAGGFVCLSGVDPETPRSIASNWRPLVWWERYEND